MVEFPKEKKFGTEEEVHYYLEVQSNPKKWHKKTDAIFSIYGKNGIIPWHFFLILCVASEVIEVEWPRLVKFWGRNLESVTLFFKVWLLTSKR